MRIVCISDTHLAHERDVLPRIPDGDVLIHAGDALLRGSFSELECFARWINRLPHRHAIFVPGNHDYAFETNPAAARMALGTGCRVLVDEGCEIDGVKFWGSPYQPEFMGWAFNLPRGAALRKHWDLIPTDTDVLITHTPPYGIGDWVDRDDGGHVGCEDMRTTVFERVRPKLHVFGHIHAGYGYHLEDSIEFVNASMCNERYSGVNPPIVVDL